MAMKTMSGYYVEAEWKPRSEAHIRQEELKNRMISRGSLAWKNVKGYLRNDLPYPECGDMQLILQVEACGICGSDTSLFLSDMDGYTDYASQCSFPVVIGHEFSGRVVEVGSKVDRFSIGDYVTCESIQWCGKCDACRRGNVNLCEHRRMIGFDRQSSGAMAQFIAVDEKYCWSLNALRSLYKERDVFELGALVEPCSCAFEAIVHNSKGIFPGDNAVIMGAGTTGLAALQLLKTMGAAKIIIFEPIPRRRELAIKMGADYALDPFADCLFSEVLMDITRGQGFGFAVEASSNPSRNFLLLDNVMRNNAQVVCVSMAPLYPRLDYMSVIRNNLTYSGSYGHAGKGNFGQVINLMASKRIEMLPFITARYPLAQIEKAIKESISKREGKIIILPSM